MNHIITIFVLMLIIGLFPTPAFASESEKQYLKNWFQKNASKMVAVSHPSATFKRASHITVEDIKYEGAVYELKGKVHFLGGFSGAEYTVVVEYYVNVNGQFIAGKWEDDTAPFAPKGSPLDVLALIPQEIDNRYYGTYEYEYGNGSMEISQSTNGTVGFEILNTTKSGCIAEVEGEMLVGDSSIDDNIIKQHTVNYTSERKAMVHMELLALEDFKIQHPDYNISMVAIYLPQDDNERGIFIIFYNNHKIYVEELAFGDYLHHGGMSCGITGNYSKK